MGTYTADQIAIPVGLDEAGLRLGLERVPNEPLADFRRRLLAEARDPATSSEDSFIRGVGRKIGELDKLVLTVDLVLDSNGEPLAADPYLEITSTHLRAYYNYDERQVDVEVFFENRNDGYWLVDVYNALAASSYFSVVTEPEYSAYIRSRTLRYGTSSKYRQQHPLFPSYQNKLRHKYIKDIRFSATSIFNNSVADVSSVANDGDYYVDSTEGVVISNATADGTCNFSYADFPYKVYSQVVRSVPLNDEDLKYRLMDELISDETGLPDRVNLSPDGARVYNQVLLAHPLGWGE